MSDAWQLRFAPYTLDLRHRFTLAGSSRTTTPTVLLELERDGIIGYGEASMPPYLGETPETARVFFERIDLARYRDPFLVADILADIDGLMPGNHAAKAAFDIALHDWVGKSFGQPWYRILGLDPSRVPATSYTIGIDAPEVIRERARDAASSFDSLKIKLGGEDDRATISAIRDVTDKPIRVDVNQGWQDRTAALDCIEWLCTQGVELVEQPLHRDRIDDLAWLRERSPLPIVGDEGVQRLADVRRAQGVYDGINVKLMKCTGLREAHAMIVLAGALDLRVMLGCMTETSCAISAAAQLAPMVEWTDLDGALLICNDPFEGAGCSDGRVTPTDRPGIGVVRRDESSGLGR